MACVNGEFSDNARSGVNSFENAIEEVQKETNVQHSLLKELKERHLKLKEELQKKSGSLQSCKTKKMILIEDLKLEEFRIKETEEKYQAELEVTEESRRKVKEIQDLLQIEKEKQIESLIIYEKKMAILAQSFREGPQHYDRKNMTKKIKNLEQAALGVRKEIEENKRQIDECDESFKKMVKMSMEFHQSASFLEKYLDEELEQLKLEIPVLKTALRSLEKLLSEQANNDWPRAHHSEE